MLNGGGGEATRGDAGVRGDTWTLCSDVVVMVMESRGGTVPAGVRVETERLLEQGLAVSVSSVCLFVSEDSARLFKQVNFCPDFPCRNCFMRPAGDIRLSREDYC